uniref:Uncharacterized protein n=1 Tax=Syphacia muris TaxID=451379 RepID=A0A0N5A9Q4_9BILA
MSNPVIVTEGLTSTQTSRKRGSPSTVTLKREGVNSASVAVGSSSSKFRRILNNTAQLGEETSTSQEQGELNTPGPSTGVVDNTGRVGGNRHSRPSRVKELQYLTDFFPDQEPSDRRLTRSQRQLSAPSSPATNNPEVGCSLNSSSTSSLPQKNSGKERSTRGRRGRGAGKLSDLSRLNIENDAQPGPSSSRFRAINSAATGNDNFYRREGTSSRVFPSGPSTSVARQQQDLDFRMNQQNAVISQVSDASHFRPYSGEGVIQVAGNVRSTTDSALDNSAVSTIAAYNLSADTHHDRGIPLRAQATHTASTFLGTLIPRVHHLLGASHSHPIDFCNVQSSAKLAKTFYVW